MMAQKAQHQKEIKYEEYFTTLFDGNIEALMEVYKMSRFKSPKAIAFFEEVMEEQGWKERFETQGMEKGMEKGRELSKIEIAKSLLDLLTDQVIATRVGLPLDKVKALREASGQ